MTTKTSTEIPDRSPYHHRALNLADLRTGLKVARHYVGDRVNRHVGIIFALPFKRDGKMMITVVAKDHTGEVAMQDWNLAEMGVVPCTGDRGPRWDPCTYTLAVED